MFKLNIDGEVELRLVDVEECEDLFNLTDQNRAYLREWLPWLDGTKTVEDTRKFRAAIAEAYDKDGIVNCGIWYQGKLAGVVGFNKLDKVHRYATIGYWLGQEFQGKGIMTRACRALIDYAFTELKLNRIMIYCATGNKKSRAIPERLGFTQEGTIREGEWLYDHFVDHAIYGLLKREWRPRG